MMHRLPRPRPGSALSSAALLLWLLLPCGALADVVLDGSFGETELTTTPLPGGTSFVIDESVGRRAGQNVFHSFSEFNVAPQDHATFTGDPARHVFSRLTGPAPGRIDGSLFSQVPGAELWFLAPNGFAIGSNATIDVPASLHLGSAQALRFDEGDDFTVEIDANARLSAAEPRAFGFLERETAHGSIVLSRGFALKPGSTFSAVGGPVLFNPRSGAPLQSAGGRVQLGSVVGSLDVPVDLSALDPRGPAIDAASLGSVDLSGTPNVDVGATASGGVSGRIVIRAGRFAMSGGRLLADSQGDARGEAAIDVAASRGIDLTNGALVAASGRGEGHGGDVRLAAPTISVAGGSARTIVGTASLGSGPAGDLVIHAESLTLGARGELLADATSDGAGGDVRIHAGKVSALAGARIQATTGAAGAGGAVEIHAGTLRVVGAQIGTATTAAGGGRGGDVVVEAATIDLSDGGRLQTSTAGSGRGGDVIVRVAAMGDDASTPEGAGRLRASNAAGEGLAGIAAVTSSSGADAGRGGNIEIEARDVELLDGAQLSATTEGSGSAGRLSIEATGDVTLEGRNAFAPAALVSQVGVDGSQRVVSGAGGAIDVRAREITLRDGAVISTVTFGEGAAGSIALEATERIRVLGGALHGEAIVASRGSRGGGGRLEMSAPEIQIASGGLVTSSTSGTGDAGDVTLRADRLLVTGGLAGDSPARSAIRSETLGQATVSVVEGQAIVTEAGRGGTTTLEVGELHVRDRALVSSQTRGEGDAGLLLVTGAATVEIATGGVLSARTDGRDREFVPGTGGVILLPAGRGGAVVMREVGEVRIDSSGVVTTDSFGDGHAGIVSIEAQRLEVSGGGAVRSSTAGTAAGGRVHVATRDEVVIDRGGAVEARSVGQAGDAGDIVIEAGNQLVMRDGRIETSAETSFGGNVTIRAAHKVDLLRSAIVTSVALEDGDGGNISIDPQFVVLNSSLIQANALAGNGGNITIVADRFLISEGSRVEASSELGIDGIIDIQSPVTDLSGELAALPIEFADLAALLQDRCSARTAPAGSLVLRGRDRIPPAPGSALPGFYPGDRDLPQVGGAAPTCAIP